MRYKMNLESVTKSFV